MCYVNDSQSDQRVNCEPSVCRISAEIHRSSFPWTVMYRTSGVTLQIVVRRRILVSASFRLIRFRRCRFLEVLCLSVVLLGRLQCPLSDFDARRITIPAISWPNEYVCAMLRGFVVAWVEPLKTRAGYPIRQRARRDSMKCFSEVGSVYSRTSFLAKRRYGL